MSLMVRYAETLTLRDNPQIRTSLYTENLRNAASTDVFIFADNSDAEWFEPPFTVHGFRYVEFRGAMASVNASDVECLFVHSESRLVGNFSSSSLVMNQIQHNILWGQLSNLMSLPTDCDNRDERKGWMGDAGLSIDESLFNFDTANLYRNFLNLIHDIQRPDGSVPNTVPEANGGFPADPNWGTGQLTVQPASGPALFSSPSPSTHTPHAPTRDCRVCVVAYPQIVWALYQHYGDMGTLQLHYRGAKAWVEHLRADADAHGLGNIHYDYGSAPNAHMRRPLCRRPPLPHSPSPLCSCVSVRCCTQKHRSPPPGFLLHATSQRHMLLHAPAADVALPRPGCCYTQAIGSPLLRTCRPTVT